MGEKLDFTPLGRAVERLQEGLARYELDISDRLIRDGLIQRFEFTYELSHKMLKRYLKSRAANPSELDSMSFQDLIRSGSEHGLLAEGWPAWRTYREMRGKTSHTYDETIALEVVADIPRFMAEALFLYQQLTGEQSR